MGFVGILLLLPLLCINGQMVIDVVFVLDSSVFPTSTYDAILQKISNGTLSSPTTLRSDFITGAEARQLYFPNSTVIRRFQLLHITRVHSVLATTLAANRLRAALIGATAAPIGECGIDVVADTPLQSPWYLSMPALVAPVALIGWIITLLSCAVCWMCVCYTDKVVPVAVLVETPPTVPFVDIPITQTTQKEKQYQSFVDIPITQTNQKDNQPPKKERRSKPGLFSATIEFQSNQPHHLEMRIPSMSSTQSACQSSLRVAPPQSHQASYAVRLASPI